MKTADIRTPSNPSPARLLRSLGVVIVLGLLVAAGTGLVLSGGEMPGMAVSAGLFALVAGASGRSFMQHYPHDRLGLCNTVTLFRAALASGVAAPLALPGLVAGDARLASAVLAVAVLALALDGVDGWLARRSGLSSDVGARFDMEVDAAFALILACLALTNGKAGLWVLALGTMRYAWLAAGLALPWLKGDLPQRFRRKAVCVVQIAVLIVLIAPGVTPPVSTLLGLAATALLCWSFATDFLWLARRR